jgi:hypothetical protein
MDTYVQNVHSNSIKVSCRVQGSGGEQLWEKVFPIQKYDYAGNEIETGFTRIAEQEYALCRKDRLFQYFQQLGKLIIHDTLPSSAQTPHEALLDARKQIRALQDQIQVAQRENAMLKQEFALLKQDTPAESGRRKKGGKQNAPEDAKASELGF